MSIRRALAAAFSFGLLLPAVASAQSYAPTEHRPGRSVLVAFSSQPPAEGWTLAMRSDSAVIYLRKGAGDDHTFVAQAAATRLDHEIKSAQELLAAMRQALHTDDRRFRMLAQEERTEVVRGLTCVRYHQRAEDDAALKRSAEPFLLTDLHGLACLHPDDPRLVIDAGLSERARTQDMGTGAMAQAEKFFAGLHPHAPVDGEAWRALADKGDPGAQTWLARAYLTGRGIAKDEAAAYAWFRKAADQGDVEAMTNVGLSYLFARGVAGDPTEAVKWLQRAAEKGYPAAAARLGLALLTTDAVRNTEEGLRWVRKAADDGDEMAQSLLGEFHTFGKLGFDRNEAAGAAWYRKAAEQGSAHAQYLVGTLYFFGRGVEKDAAQAVFWLELAAAQGNEDARKALAQLKRKPT